MPVLWIPPLLRELTGGEETIRVHGETVRQALDHLEAVHPGVRARLCEGDRLRPGLALVVDGRASRLGLAQRLSESSEVHFLPLIAGG
jgi:sulfur-carrier protein